MIEYRCRSDSRKPWIIDIKKGTAQAGNNFIIVLGVLKWHGLGLLVYLSMSFTDDYYVALMTICTYLIG